MIYSDLELAQMFFYRLKQKGFRVDIRDFSGRLENSPEFDVEEW